MAVLTKITSRSLADSSITAAHVQLDALAAGDIAAGAITASELATNAVTTVKINADAIDGTKLADNAVNSEHVTAGAVDTAHIGDDQVTGAKIENNPTIAGNLTVSGTSTLSSIKQTDAQNLTGTYSNHEMVMGKTFTLTGDITVNDNLILGNLSGAGNDITIVDDGSGRTITGVGTLEVGDILGTVPQRTSITGMTGTIGSGVSFPTGYGRTILSSYDELLGSGNTTSTTGIGFGVVGEQLMAAGSSIHILMHGGNAPIADGARQNYYSGVNYKWDSTFTSSTDGSYEINVYAVSTSTGVDKIPGTAMMSMTNTYATTKTLFFRPYIRSTNSSYNARWEGGDPAATGSIKYMITYVE